MTLKPCRLNTTEQREKKCVRIRCGFSNPLKLFSLMLHLCCHFSFYCFKVFQKGVCVCVCFGSTLFMSSFSLWKGNGRSQASSQQSRVSLLHPTLYPSHQTRVSLAPSAAALPSVAAVPLQRSRAFSISIAQSSQRPHTSRGHDAAVLGDEVDDAQLNGMIHVMRARDLLDRACFSSGAATSDVRGWLAVSAPHWSTFSFSPAAASRSPSDNDLHWFSFCAGFTASSCDENTTPPARPMEGSAAAPVRKLLEAPYHHSGSGSRKRLRCDEEIAALEPPQSTEDGDAASSVLPHRAAAW